MLNDIINILLPQINLIFFIILLLVLSFIMPLRSYKYARLISIIGISATIILLTTVQVEPQYFGFKNCIMSDSYTLLFHFIILVCAFFVTLLGRSLVKTIKRHAYEYYAVLLTAVFGAMNVVSANDFITLYVSIEMLSFSTYFLIASSKGYYSKEASFKYLITSAVSTGVFLFGVSYLYGITGSINLFEIYKIIISKDSLIMYSASSILIVMGLFSKLAIFPFANWVIDVYKGTESSVLAFLSTIPKLALFGIICRLLVFPLGSSFELTVVIAIVSIITAFWANMYALREKNVKVILGCSTSANCSYAMLTACLVSVYNLSTVIFYIMCYVFMNIAAFAFLNIYGENDTNVDSFKSIFHKNHGLSSAYAIAIIGLAGFPITSGFISKIYLFSAIACSGYIFIPLLLILLLLTVIALFYYLKILLPIFEESDKNSEPKVLKPIFSQKFVLVAATAITLFIGFFPEIFIEICKYIAYNI